MMPDLVGGEPPLTDDPLGWMAASHRRLERRLAWLQQLAARIVEQPEAAELEAIAGLAQIQRFFATELIHHHADEEETLFPRLLERDPALGEAIRQTQDEHVLGEPLHVRFDRLASRLVAQEAIRSADREEIRLLARALLASYTPHMAREDEVLLPAAQRMLDPATLVRMGLEMQDRRGLPAAGAR